MKPNSNPPLSRPQWQLPAGVSRGTWDYVHSDLVADDYDNYFEGNSLFEFDQRILLETFQKRADRAETIVMDLGCGTGRALMPFLEAGFHGIAVDLSERMLEIVRDKANHLSVSPEQVQLQCIRANLVELDCLADHSIDYAMCMFSTLGMIRGEPARIAMLKHVRRILREDGVFIFHIHNFWYNLYDPGGPKWLLKNIWQSWFDRDLERGDKYFPYRGVNQMFLHVFSRGELKRILRKAGFRQLRFIALAVKRNQPLRLPGCLQSLRANGWIVVCR